MRQQGSDGAKLRHHPHDDPEATATRRQATSTASPTHESATGRAATASRPPAHAAAASHRPAAVDAAQAARGVAARRLAPRAPPRDAALAGAVGALLAVSI